MQDMKKKIMCLMLVCIFIIPVSVRAADYKYVDFSATNEKIVNPGKPFSTMEGMTIDLENGYMYYGKMYVGANPRAAGIWRVKLSDNKYLRNGTVPESSAVKDRANKKKIVQPKKKNAKRWIPPNRGKLCIVNKTKGRGASANRIFKYELKISNKKVNGTYNGIYFKRGKAVFYMKGSQKITISGLPAKSKYSISSSRGTKYYTTEYKNESGKIKRNASREIIVSHVFHSAYSDLKCQPIMIRNDGELKHPNDFIAQTDGDKTILYFVYCTSGMEKIGKITLNTKTGRVLKYEKIPYYASKESDKEMYIAAIADVIGDEYVITRTNLQTGLYVIEKARLEDKGFVGYERYYRYAPEKKGIYADGWYDQNIYYYNGLYYITFTPKGSRYARYNNIYAYDLKSDIGEDGKLLKPRSVISVTAGKDQNWKMEIEALAVYKGKMYFTTNGGRPGWTKQDAAGYIRDYRP